MTENSAEGGKVRVEDVRRMAELAHLELSGAEESRMLRDLNAILGHVAQLNELNTADVEPMAQVSEVLGRGQENVLRADEVGPSLARESVMGAAPQTDGTFFKVPKVIER